MASVRRIELRQLLSTCLALSRAACDAIREVQVAREAQVNSQTTTQRPLLLQGNEALATILKDASDPRTALSMESINLINAGLLSELILLLLGRRIHPQRSISHQQFVREHLVPHPQLVALLRDVGVQGPEGSTIAVDLLRDISSGEVITATQLGQLLGVDGVTSYYALEAEAARFRQSEACRLRTNIGHSAFLKRVVLRELPSVAVKAR